MRNTHIPSLAIAAILTLTSCQKSEVPQAATALAETSEPRDPFSRITADELLTKMTEARAGSLKLAIFDNNGLDTYKEGHIPGATWVQYDEIKASDLPPDKGTMLVFYCYNEHCHASHIGARSAVKLGYSKVFVLPIGIAGWKKAGKAIEKSG